MRALRRSRSTFLGSLSKSAVNGIVEAMTECSQCEVVRDNGAVVENVDNTVISVVKWENGYLKHP